jgi:hypothetical protein
VQGMSRSRLRRHVVRDERSSPLQSAPSPGSEPALQRLHLARSDALPRQYG